MNLPMVGGRRGRPARSLPHESVDTVKSTPIPEKRMGKGERAGKPAKRAAKKNLKEKRQAKHEKKSGPKQPEVFGEHKR